VPYCRKFDFPTGEDPSLAIEVSDEFTKRKKLPQLHMPEFGGFLQ
jgi:hypothetical protein